nr:molybdate ABC transporter substrate-binding protein [Desulfobulbaceae bacterium]
MPFGCKILVTVLLLQIVSVVAVQAQTIHLSVTASMTDAVNDMIKDFSAKHTKAKFLPNFASSGSLAKQIEQGAPADIYVSANPKWMKYLVEKELIAPDTDHIFAFNQLVFAGAQKSTALSLAG